MEDIFEKIKTVAHKDILSDNVDARREYLRMFSQMPEIQYLVERLANELIRIPENYFPDKDKHKTYFMPSLNALEGNQKILKLFYDVIDKENLRNLSDDFETAKKHIKNFLIYGYFESANITDEDGKPITEEWYSDGQYYISYIETLVRSYNLIRQAEDAFVIKRFTDNVYETNTKFFIPKDGTFKQQPKKTELSDEIKELIYYLRRRFIDVSHVPESFFKEWELESPDTDSIVKDYDYYRLRQRIYKHYECWINKMVDAEAKKQGIEVKEPISIYFLAENH